jgi:hypothetical protein
METTVRPSTMPPTPTTRPLMRATGVVEKTIPPRSIRAPFGAVKVPTDVRAGGPAGVGVGAVRARERAGAGSGGGE